MAEQQNNMTNVDTSVLAGGMITDVNDSNLPKEAYTYARNAVKQPGEQPYLANEPSNAKCYSAPYPINGIIALPDDTDLVFSTDESSSEIGIGNRKDCTYRTLRNLKEFNFSRNYPITGVAKQHFGKGIVVTFTDKNNPVRRAVVEKLPTLTDVDDILLFKKIIQPKISIDKGIIGTIPNGSYALAMAYTVDGQIFSDFYSLTPRYTLYSETGTNSLQVILSGLDKEFKTYMVVMVGSYEDPVTKGVTKVARQIGEYSTKVSKLSITDFLNSTYKEIPLSQIVIRKKAWKKAGIISSNSNYLLLGDLVATPEENYQLKAMTIEAEYVVEQVEADYYRNDGSDVGYYRDENYDYYINGVYTTGERTDKYHIPGRVATSDDLSIAASADVYEYDTQFNDCEEPGRIPNWRVNNTAGKLLRQNNEFKCNRRVLGTGKMGYFESTELYPDNPAMFGKWANTPIRFHKFPDECKVSRYSTINGKTYINILGIRFKNIPSFDSPDIIGYEITRSDRKGGNGTVIARGLMGNLRGYTDNQSNQRVLFSNYPVNDLAPDTFLSSTQTRFKNNREEQYTPLTEYYKDRFTFHSPHTLFEPRYSLGNELKIEAEEVAIVQGRFEKVYNHPRQKLMNQFSFWLAAAVGFIESSLVLLGKQRSSTSIKSGNLVGPTGGNYSDVTVNDDYNITSIEDLLAFDIVGYVGSLGASAAGASAAAATAAKGGKVIKIVKAAIKIIAALAVKVPYSILAGIVEAEKIMDIIYGFTGYTDYVYQYNAHASFHQSFCVQQGDKRRRLLNPAIYIPSTPVSIEDEVFNNLLREKVVYLHLNKEISNPVHRDNSRNTITGFGISDNPTKTVQSQGSMFYVTSKVSNPNQYGMIGSADSVILHSGTLSGAETPILYGGDCVIARVQIQKRMQFFNQNLANTNYSDGVEYDYRLYRNIAYPRFWMDSTKYDFSELLSGNVVNFTRFSRTTTSKHNLDNKKRIDGKSISRIDDAYMYLSNNCVLDFFCECDYNVHFREKTEYPHYSKENTNLSQIFRSDRLDTPEVFKLSRAYSDLYSTEIALQQQRLDYTPETAIPQQQPNAVIYSLPSFNLQEVDNWQYFLPANYFSFAQSDFGQLSAIHKLDQDRLIFLFSKSSPYVSMGRDFLQLEGSGRKITIGDGGLFAQDPRELLPSDNNYGACSSRYGFINTHLGRIYPTENQGRIINYGDSLEDVTRQGMLNWCRMYMPIQLYDYFPEYPRIENPLKGIGYLSTFDAASETVFLSKRDYVPKPSYREELTYNRTTGKFYYKGNIIEEADSTYFNDASWTLSYSPIEKRFISYHDWHPDWVITGDNHFATVKGNTLWKHHERTDSFCNFYGKDYSFEVEVSSATGQTVHTLRSLEYLLEVYKYKNFGRNRFHVLNENFDHLIVYNTEQISPVLNLTLDNLSPRARLNYPRKSTKNNVSYDVLYSKEENKYRINQFWSSLKDRGEFSTAEYHLFPIDESGYRSVVNPLAIDINKPEKERTRFRHYLNRVRLIKSTCGSNKFLFKMINIKQLISPR